MKKVGAPLFLFVYSNVRRLGLILRYVIHVHFSFCPFSIMNIYAPAHTPLKTVKSLRPRLICGVSLSLSLVLISSACVREDDGRALFTSRSDRARARTSVKHIFIYSAARQNICIYYYRAETAAVVTCVRSGEKLMDFCTPK